MGDSTRTLRVNRVVRLEQVMLANGITDSVLAHEHFLNTADSDRRRRTLLDVLEVGLFLLGALLVVGGVLVIAIMDNDIDRWLVPYGFAVALVGVVIGLLGSAIGLRERKDSLFLVGGPHGWYVVEPASGQARQLSPSATIQRRGDAAHGHIEIFDGPHRWSGPAVVWILRRTGTIGRDNGGGMRQEAGRTIIRVPGRPASLLRRGEEVPGFRLVFTGGATELIPDGAAPLTLSPNAALTVKPAKWFGIELGNRVTVTDGAQQWSGVLSASGDQAGRLQREWKARLLTEPVPPPPPPSAFQPPPQAQPQAQPHAPPPPPPPVALPRVRRGVSDVPFFGLRTKKAGVRRALAKHGISERVLALHEFRDMRGPERAAARNVALGLVILSVLAVAETSGGAVEWIILGFFVAVLLGALTPWGRRVRRGSNTVELVLTDANAYLLSIDAGWVHLLSAEARVIRNGKEWVSVTDGDQVWQGPLWEENADRCEQFDRLWKTVMRP